MVSPRGSWRAKAIAQKSDCRLSPSTLGMTLGKRYEITTSNLDDLKQLKEASTLDIVLIILFLGKTQSVPRIY